MKSASDLFQASPFLKVLIYGPSGAGKTWWSARSPTPFHLLCEPQGLESIAAANPASMVEMIDSFEKADAIIQAMKKGAPCMIGDQPGFKWRHGKETITAQTLVIDSITEIQELLLNKYLEGKSQLTIQDWGFIGRDIKRMLSDLRSLPINVVCLALRYEEKTKDGEVVGYQPGLMGQAKNFAPRYFSAVGVATKVNRKGIVNHYLTWDAKEAFVSKRPPVPEGIAFPGTTTASLGSILMALYPNVKTPHRDSDSPEQLDT